MLYFSQVEAEAEVELGVGVGAEVEVGVRCVVRRTSPTLKKYCEFRPQFLAPEAAPRIGLKLASPAFSLTEQGSEVVPSKCSLTEVGSGEVR
jgi:hypothetical protein